ncbi:LAFE_0G02564g1_1 [Lachancea fermentati]|uniref:LAFE_0G02564g1_1 n=1 Tax=Lachancea fermentati TaxID=4955 RepID=A0A1G4MGP4_LACFM|nr:LAFE_0G02564g1_1 [Lachancea fermentati]
MVTSKPSIRFRDYQLEVLSSFINEYPDLVPPNLVIHGHSSSGKTFTLQEFFNHNSHLINCWLTPFELVTWKPLLQHVARTISMTLRKKFPLVEFEEQDALEAEDFYLLIKFLHYTLINYQRLEQPVNVFVVLDGFDQLQELDSELLPKFIKLHEMLPINLKIQLKFIYTIQDRSFLNRYATYELPTVIFPRYTLQQVTQILLDKKIREFMESEDLLQKVLDCNIDPEDSVFEQVAENYIRLMIQAFQSYTGNDVVALDALMDAKWECYISSITIDNINDPLALYRSNIDIFVHTGDTLNDEGDEIEQTDTLDKTTAYELSSISKYLLIAAYLCSYLEQRYDSKIFSKKSHLRAGRSSYGRRHKMDTNPRYLQPSLFQLERLFSIFQAIYPAKDTDGSASSGFDQKQLMRANVEVYENLAELNSLKLITTAIPKNVDYLSYKLKWKVNVPWEIIIDIASTVDFDIAEYFSGLHD